MDNIHFKLLLRLHCTLIQTYLFKDYEDISILTTLLLQLNQSDDLNNTELLSNSNNTISSITNSNNINDSIDRNIYFLINNMNRISINESSDQFYTFITNISKEILVTTSQKLLFAVCQTLGYILWRLFVSYTDTFEIITNYKIKDMISLLIRDNIEIQISLLRKSTLKIQLQITQTLLYYITTVLQAMEMITNIESIHFINHEIYEAQLIRSLYNYIYIDIIYTLLCISYIYYYIYDI